MNLGLGRLIIFYFVVYCQNQRIRGLLEKCTSDHESRMENLHSEMREKAISDAKWRQIQQDLNQPVSPTIIISYQEYSCVQFYSFGYLIYFFILMETVGHVLTNKFCSWYLSVYLFPVRYQLFYEQPPCNGFSASRLGRGRG